MRIPERIEADTKWPPFYSRHFQMNFLFFLTLFWLKFQGNLYLLVQYSIGFDNGVARNRRQYIIWTNDGVPWSRVNNRKCLKSFVIPFSTESVSSHHRTCSCQLYIVCWWSNSIPLYLRSQYIIWMIETLRHLQNCRHFIDDIQYIFLKGDVFILMRISLRFVPRSLMPNNVALVQVMPWHRTGHKPLPEPMMTQLTDEYMRHQAPTGNIAVSCVNRTRLCGTCHSDCSKGRTRTAHRWRSVPPSRWRHGTW